MATGISITPVAQPKTNNGVYKVCLTVNNYTDVDLEVCRGYVEDSDVVCMVVGKEVAPTTGTPHLQCYFRTVKPHRFSHWKKKFPGAHIELANGTDEQNIEYCSKENVLFLKNPPEHTATGKKRDREEIAFQVIEEIERGDTFREIRQRHKVFCFWHRRSVLEYKRDEDFLNSNPNDWPV